MFCTTTFRAVINTLAVTLLLSATQVVAQDGLPPLPKLKHVIDTHIHLFDTTRADGVPWPPSSDTVLYKPHLPTEYTAVAKAAGVTGVVVVEASDRLADNTWVLDQMTDPMFVGLVGNIDPYRKDFGTQLAKLRKDERFVGIRARNKKPIDYLNEQVLTNFRILEELDLTLDILANGKGVAGVNEVTQLADKVPNLKIVVDHVLGYDIDGKPPGQDWLDAVAALAKHPNVHCKVSGLYQRCTVQPASQDPSHYKTVLDVLWKNFGQKRLIYGSNWPCTKKSGSYESFLRLVNGYFLEKGEEACDRFFWKNAKRFYAINLPRQKKKKKGKQKAAAK